MQTVESVISTVYGTDAGAAAKLGVGRSAVSNWKKWGHFPTRAIPSICQHAKEIGADIDVSEIPIMPKLRPENAN